MWTNRHASRTAAPRTATPASDWSAGRRRYALALLGLASVLNFLDRQALTILVEPIKAEFHLSDTRIGLLTGAVFAVFYVAAAIPMARWLDYGSRKTILAATLAIWSLATMAAGFATSYVHLVITRIGVAIAETSAVPAQASLTADLYPGPGLARAMSVLTMGAAIGVGMALLIGGVVAANLGWRAVFWVVGAPGVLLALLILFGFPEPQRRTVSGGEAKAAREPVGRVFAHLWSLRSYRWILVSYGCQGFTGFATTVWSPSLLIRLHHMPIAQVGFWLAISSIAGLCLGAFAIGQLSAALARRDIRWNLRLGGAGLLMSVPAGLAIAFSPNAATAIVGIFFLHLGNSFCLPTAGAMVQSIAPPRMRGMASAMTNLCQTLAGIGLGPLVVGMLNDALMPSLGVEGMRVSLATSLTGAFIAGLALLRANRHTARDYAAATAAAPPDRQAAA